MEQDSNDFGPALLCAIPACHGEPGCRERGKHMSFSANIILSAMGAVKKTGIIKSPGMDADANLKRAREYNRKHPYKEPSDRKAAYKTIYAGGYPCLVIRQRQTPLSGKAILFLHGGGDTDAWKPEVAFARNYGKKAGMDVFYPLYPPFSEASPIETADLIFEVYRKLIKKYGADKTAIVADSYGGFLAMQLLTWINRYNAAVEKEPVRMPELLIMNLPFAYPKTSEEWRLAEELEKIDVMLPVGAFRYMFGLTKRVAPETPDYALYPMDMDFHNAPETYVFYAEEACAAVADAIENSYVRDGSGGKIHMHREPGMMHCYASAPVFKESRRDFNRQIALLQQL